MKNNRISKTPDNSKTKPSKSPAPLSTAKTTMTIFEMNNAQFQGDVSSFMRHGFGIVIGDDSTFFAGNFHRDMLQGYGAVFKDGTMLYANFQKGYI